MINRATRRGGGGGGAGGGGYSGTERALNNDYSNGLSFTSTQQMLTYIRKDTFSLVGHEVADTVESMSRSVSKLDPRCKQNGIPVYMYRLLP